jgi:hypothetical protein
MLANQWYKPILDFNLNHQGYFCRARWGHAAVKLMMADRLRTPHWRALRIYRVGEASFSFNSAQALLTSAVTSEQVSIWKKTRLPSSR